MTAPALELLDCTVARARIGIPRASVVQLIEYELAPLPAGATYVGGVGVHAAGLVYSIALTPALGHERRWTRGVLVQGTGGGAAARWSIEVTHVGGFTAASWGEDGDGESGRASWLRRARLAHGPLVIAVDVPAMIAQLAGGVR